MSTARPLGRGVLWGFLVGVILAIAVLFWWSRWGRQQMAPPPPVLAEIPDFSLTDSRGETVTRADLLGSPWIADLIFTRCVLACPIMSGKMSTLDDELPREGENGEPPVRLVSISVDPEHDRPEVLAEYADRWEASDRWWFLTGDRSEIIHLAIDGLRLGFDHEPRTEPLGPGDDIPHSTRFVLVDSQARVRGYYEMMQGNDLDQLRRDLAALE